MARIRTIKPEFPQSESMGRISREARLCFILLWTVVDDSGRTRASSRLLASLLYPYDDDAAGRIDGWLAELDAEHCIDRYTVDGNAYLQIAKWLIHQKIDRPSESRLPAFDESSRILANPRVASDADLGPRTVVPRTMDQVPNTLASTANAVPANESKPDQIFAKPRKAKAEKPADPRHEPFRLACQTYAIHKGVVFAWDGSEAKALESLLKAAPTLTLQQFQGCLTNRARSPGCVHADRPRMYLGTILSFQQHALNQFKQPEGTNGTNRSNEGTSGAEQRSATNRANLATVAGRRYGIGPLATHGANNGAVFESGPNGFDPGNVPDRVGRDGRAVHAEEFHGRTIEGDS